MNISNKLETCRRVRLVAAESLYNALSQILKQKKVSETQLRDRWLLEMRKNSQIFPEGWYIPPPNGIAVLFASNKDITRVSPKSLRPKEFWPRNDIYLDKTNGIVLLYASPVDKISCIIGDFGLILYLGKNKKIQKHLKICYKAVYEIFNYAKIGMKFSELNIFTHTLLKSKGLVSNLSSPTDPISTNIGHTIPFSYKELTSDEIKIFRGDKWEEISNMISKKRIFVNSEEKFKIRKGMAFTIEPRPFIPNNSQIPTAFFHTIAIFKENGQKELLTDFNELFKLVEMDYMLKG